MKLAAAKKARQGSTKKYNFDKQIKDLKSIFNWYSDNILPEDYIFHSRGKPLRYNAIGENYNKAWERAGLRHKFRGTHQLRYATDQRARRRTGNIDMAKTVTGHKSSRMA